MCQSIPIRHPGSAPKPVDANPRHVDSKAPWPANAAAAITDLDVDTMHSVLAFLALPDRVQFASTSKLLAEAGLSTNLKTYCGECACCHSNVRFLCNDAPQRTWTVPTWTAMLNRFGHALTELHLVGCADLAPSMFESAPSQRMLKNLRVLRIDMCTGLDARALQAIVETCSHLRKAHIMNMRLDDAGLAALLASNRATLREVDLSGCHLLDGTGFRALRSTQVEVMSLEGCHRINVFELDTMLKSCTTLRSLNLQYCHSADDTVARSIAANAPALEHLNMRYCCKLSDAGVAALCSKLANLKTLDLSQCPRITNVAVSAIARSMGRLDTLKVWSCRQISASSNLAELRKTALLCSPFVLAATAYHSAWGHGDDKEQPKRLAPSDLLGGARQT